MRKKRKTCENLSHHIEKMFSVATKTNKLFQTNYFSLTDSRSIDFSNAVLRFRLFTARILIEFEARIIFGARRTRSYTRHMSLLEGQKAKA